MQIVLSKNRVIAYGENFLAMGGTVVNTETDARFDNATVAECDCVPSDIGVSGYEYHSGVFVPCAPYGKADNTGYLMEVCGECATPRNSRVPIKNAKWETVASKDFDITGVASVSEGTKNITLTIPIDASKLTDYTEYRIVLKSGTFDLADTGNSGSHTPSFSLGVNILGGTTDTRFTITGLTGEDLVYSPENLIMGGGFIATKCTVNNNTGKTELTARDTHGFEFNKILLSVYVCVYEAHFTIEIQARG